MLGFIILSFGVTLLISWIAKLVVLRWKYARFVGPETRWLVNLHQFGPDRPLELVKLAQQYQGKVFRLYVAPWVPWLILSDPHSHKLIMKTKDPKLDDAYYSLAPWLGQGLLLASGKKWSRNRRLLTPAFHFDILKPYLGVANEAVDILVEVMAKHADTEEYFNVMPYVSLSTLDILVRCSMSAETNCQTEEKSTNPYVEAVEEMSILTMERTVNTLHRLDFVYNLTSNGREMAKNLKILHDSSAKVISDRRKALADNPGEVLNSKYRDFLDILLTARDEEGNGLTDKEIRDEVDTFMFEGHDTTAHGIGWSLYCLGLNPEHQQKCREEVDKIMESSQGELEWDDMSKLRYTHMCIRESMRIFPPVPVAGRRTTEDMEIDGTVLPAGSGVILSIFGLHRNPAVWENPMEFQPSRFTDAEMKKRDPYAYVPFSAGPRNCIGQIFASHEMKITIAKILHEYYVETEPDQDLQLRFALVLRPMAGLKIRLRRRSHN